MEAATSRTIRIGTANIGLIGLDIALNNVAAENMTEDEAIDYLFTTVSKKNYIPSGSEEKYRDALRAEFRRHMHLDDQQTAGLIIRIFGTGCISCNNLQIQVIEVINSMNLAADIEQIHDPDEIGRHGIIMTPALMINGKVKSGGRIPTLAQIEQWIREAVQHG
ncbi:MAG: MTH895/ArsE family thioredoxin-like protein [Desulfobulbaceae bacterium]|nr:MTH895/ArsE family thioredoxin-like protein [Desulfobulbaceae bacterium]